MIDMILVCDDRRYKKHFVSHYRRQGKPPPSRFNNVTYESIYTKDGTPVAYHCDAKGERLVSAKVWQGMENVESR